MQSQPKRQKKRPYQKPKLRVIELAAEEVLGVGCKTNQGVGALSAPCDAGCHQIGAS
ncbi:MAG: hypothetical protein ACOC8A_01730 [bacterium]